MGRNGQGEPGANSLWEFGLRIVGGAITDQIVIGEGPNEPAAADRAVAALALSPGASLIRPGIQVDPEAEARWRSLCAQDAFPLVMAKRGRTAMFARGR